MVCSTLFVSPTMVFSKNKVIEYDSEFFGYIPSQSVYVDGKEYKQYFVVESYEGLSDGDVIYVDSDNHIVTDRALLEKLAYTSTVKVNISIAKDAYNIINLIEEITPALGILNDLGNDLIEKTLSSALSCNFKGIISAASGDGLGYFEAYSDFIVSSGIEGTLYLSYLMNLYSLTSMCIENSEKLIAFNDTVAKKLDSSGLSYENAKRYEAIVRDCMSALKTTEDYTVYLAQCVSGSGVNNSPDALGVLKNMTVDFIGEAFRNGIAVAFTEDISNFIGNCHGFDDLFEATYKSLKIDEKLEKYYREYELYSSDDIYFIDVNDVIKNVSILTKEDIPAADNNSNDNSTPTTPVVQPSNNGTLKYKGSDFSDNANIASRIDAVFAKYYPGNSYFTKNGRACNCHTNYSFSCVNSPSACNCLRWVNINGKTVDLLAVQCFGYARYWQQMLFDSHEKNSSNFSEIGGISGTLSAAKVKDWFVANKDVLHPGTHIRVYGENHSIILLGVDYNKGTVTYIQCNWVNQNVNNGNWCKVSSVITDTWQSFASNFSTLNYAQVYKNYYSKYPEGNKLTINYNANGGVIPAPEAIGEKYKITASIGITVRADANKNSADLGAVACGQIVTVTEKKTAGGYTWGKITYAGKQAWIALGDSSSSYTSKVGTAWNRSYSVDNNVIVKLDNSQKLAQTCTYGNATGYRLYDDSDFGLYRDGYEFVGWSLSSSGGSVFATEEAIKPETIAPSVVNGSQTVTLYAVWKEKELPVTDHTVEKIYVSTIPQKEVYLVGETVDKSDIKIIVQHTDGSLEYTTSGFTCDPSVISKEGKQEIKVTYQGKSATFSINATKSKEMVNNATSKVDSTGYFLPSTSAATLLNIGGSYKNDVMQVLCKEGDFYLCFFPWNASTTTKENGVLMYFKASDIQVNGTVPTSAEYFSMNPTGKANAVVLSDAKLYYRADGGANPVKYNGKAVAENTVSKNASVRVLFEMNGYYCVQTDKYIGFVTKDKVKLTTVSPYTVNASVSDIKVTKGEKVDASSVTLKETLTDGSVNSISAQNYSITLPGTDTVGDKYAIATKGELSTLIKVSVSEVKVKELIIEKMPEKLAYVVGESFDPKGMTVKAVFDDGKTKDVTGEVKLEYSFREAGDVLVGVKYESYSQYIPVIVYEKPKVEVLDIDAYVGQTVIVPICCITESENIVPAAFNMTVSYDAEKISYVGLENAGLYNVKVVSNNTLTVSYKADAPITDYLLVKLKFKALSSGDDNKVTKAKVSVDSLELSDSLGNEFETVLAEGNIFNLGKMVISFVLDGFGDAFTIKFANYGEMLRIPEHTPEMDGHTFIGWSLIEDSREDLYEAGDSIECTENITFYAVWEDTVEPDEDEGNDVTNPEIDDNPTTNEDPDDTTTEDDGKTDDKPSEGNNGNNDEPSKEPQDKGEASSEGSLGAVKAFVSNNSVLVAVVIIGFILILIVAGKKKK